MESSEQSPFDLFKSKKMLHSASKPSPSDQTACAIDQSPWSTKTPEKPANLPCRFRNRRTVMSIKEVRDVAEKLQKSDHDRSVRCEPIRSSGQQIASWPSGSSMAKLKKVESSVKLPEKYEILSKFFDSLDCSIRLLRLKGTMPTFTNINPKIEYLTDRRFTHGHLAQLKFILPEAIEIKKVLVCDERTNCRTPELHITLNLDAISDDGKQKTESGNSYLRKVFRTRLLDFFEAHPEGVEVPEEALPEPFNHSKPDAFSGHQAAAAASHLSQSFKRRFSQKVSQTEPWNGKQEASELSLQPSILPVSESSPLKFSSNPPSNKSCLALRASVASLSMSHTPTTPIKEKDSSDKEASSYMRTDNILGTPAKLTSTPAKLMSNTPGQASTPAKLMSNTPAQTSTPAKLMSATPTQQPPKRCYMSPDDDSTSSMSKLVRRPSRSRALKFDTPVKNANLDDEVNTREGLSVDDDIFEILPQNLLQSIREKERKAKEEQDPAISQAKWRQQMIASLPRLFDMIYFLFQSINHSVITKEELVHRIIVSHLQITDRREVEEQLRLLQELVPEWIYEKLASTGDLLIRVNKISCPNSIRTRLAEAK